MSKSKETRERELARLRAKLKGRKGGPRDNDRSSRRGGAPPGIPVIGSRLEFIAVHYRNPKGSKFEVRLHRDGRDDIDIIGEKLRAALVEYNNDPGRTVERCFAELDAIAVKFDPYQHTLTPSNPLGTVPAKLKEELGFEAGLIAFKNVHWLEHNGHLVSDEFNGMQFAWSKPDPTKPGARTLVVRPTLDELPEQIEAFEGLDLGPETAGTIQHVHYTPRKPEVETPQKHEEEDKQMPQSKETREREIARLRAQLKAPALRPGDDEPAVTRFVVGARYPLAMPQGVDGTYITIDEGGLILSIFMPRPIPSELESIQGEPLELRLHVAAHTLFFHFRSGGGLWKTEGIYSPWRGAAEGNELFGDPGPGYGIPLQVCMVDSNTNTLMGMRVTTLSRNFCTAVLAGCRAILDRPMDDDAHAREVHEHSQMPMEDAAEQAEVRFSTATKN